MTELKAWYNDLSNFQALHVACEIRRNEILNEAHLIKSEDGEKATLEMIVTALSRNLKRPIV